MGRARYRKQSKQHIDEERRIDDEIAKEAWCVVGRGGEERSGNRSEDVRKMGCLLCEFNYLVSLLVLVEW